MDDEKKDMKTDKQEVSGESKDVVEDIPMTNAELHRKREDIEFLVSEMERRGDDVTQTKKWLELIDNEHDNTGAMKRKFFGLEMQALLSRKEMVEEVEGLRRKMLGGSEARDVPRLDLDSEGNVVIPEGENQSFVFVNMGELDRFNKEGGGHDAGDRGLLETQAIVENTTLKTLEEAGVEYPNEFFTVYRFSGNEFVVSIREIEGDGDRQEAERIRSVIADRIVGQGPTVEGVKEPAPLVVTTMELKDSIGLFSDLQAEMEEGKRLTDPDLAARELFGLTASYADHALDVKKFESRVRRVLGKIDEADGDLEQARPFFENYMKKMFTGTELENIEDFAELDRGRIPEMSLEYARGNMGKQSDFEDVQADVVRKEMERVRGRDIIDARLRDMRMPTAETDRGREASGVELAVIPDRTNGQVSLGDRMAEYMAASDDEIAPGFTEREAAGLDYMIEFARRDQGTGLLERGVHYEALEKSFEEKEDSSMLFIDMGFLKYFDKAGGRDVGNNALKFAADLMEKAVEESGVEATVFRYAGDEFTVKVDGGQEQAAEFMAKLKELNKEDVPEKLVIPQGKLGDEGGYYPTELVFNHGFSDSAAAESVFSDLDGQGKFTENDLADAKYVNNKKAELMTMIADKGIANTKATGRFNLLIDRMRDPSYREVHEQLQEKGVNVTSMSDGQEALMKDIDIDEEARNFWTQTEQMAVYSSKAIFAEDGGANLLRAWAESGRPIEELQNEIETFVEQSIEEAEGAEKEGRNLRDRLVEIHARADYFEKKVGEMQKELADTKGDTQTLKDEVDVLQDMLKQVRDEKRQLTGRRKAVDEAA